MRRIPPLVLAALLTTTGACASDAGTSSTTTRADRTTTTVDATTTTTVPAVEAYAVGRRTVEMVDTSRSTDADPSRGIDEQPSRTLSVLILYPAEGAPTMPTTPVDDAPVADGTFPLVVFSHGLTASGPVYEGRLREWARAGYIVAAPTFPLTSGSAGAAGDYVNQPGDVSFVIGRLLALPGDDVLEPHLDQDAVGVAGHSLGAMTTIGVSLNSCCIDDRIDAAVEISGMRLPFRGGAYDDLGRLPLLLIHGGSDDIVPVRGSDLLYADSPGSVAYLRLPAGGHTDILFGTGPLIDEVVIAFFDSYLKGDDEAFAAIAAVVEASGDATFEQKP